MNGKDELQQLLQGSWGALYGRVASQYIFYRKPQGNSFELQGFRVSSSDYIRNDSKDAKTVKFALTNVKVFSKFGMVYISFMQTNDSVWIEAMIDPKDLTMKGTLTNPQNQTKPFFAKKTNE